MFTNPANIDIVKLF